MKYLVLLLIIETNKSMTSPMIVKVTSNTLTSGEECLAAFLRRAVPIKMLRKARLDTARAELRADALEVDVEQQEIALAESIADISPESDVEAVMARRCSKALALAIENAEKAVDHYNCVYDRKNMDVTAPQRNAAQLAGDKAMFLSALIAMYSIKPKLVGLANQGNQHSRVSLYLLRYIKWCDDTIESISNGTYDCRRIPPALDM